MINRDEKISEIQNNTNCEISQEEFSKSILLDVGHKEIPNNLFKAYLDNKKYIYYAQIFSIFTKGADKFAFTWNLYAFFVPSFWLLYRKMYLYGALALTLSTVLTFASLMLLDMDINNNAGEASNRGIMTEVIIGFIVNVIIGFMGNYLYFCHTKKKLLKIISNSPSEQQQEEAKIQGGTNPIIVWLIAIIIALILAYILVMLIMMAGILASAASAGSIDMGTK